MGDDHAPSCKSGQGEEGRHAGQVHMTEHNNLGTKPKARSCDQPDEALAGTTGTQQLPRHFTITVCIPGVAKTARDMSRSA
jgi:hypothetical protein